MYKVGEKGLVGGSKFHKFADGVTIILMTTEDCGLAFEHWLDDPEGNRKRIVCPGGNAKGRYGHTPDDCKICARYEATGDEIFKPKRRFFIKFVICDAKKVKIKGRRGKHTVNYVPQKDVKLAAVGPKIFNGIQGLAEDADEYGDITEIPIKVKRSGAGLNTEYTVLPLSADKLINIPKEYVDDNPSLEDVEKESTEAEVDAVLGEGDDDDAEDMDYLDEEDSKEEDSEEEDEDSDEEDSDGDDSEEGEEGDDEGEDSDDDSEEDEDEDYEIDDDEEEEEEEEEPVKKKKKKVMLPPLPSKKKKKGNKSDTKKKKDEGDLKKKKPSLGRLKRSNRR